VTAAWGDGERRGFDAAVQRQGDTLTVLGLSPAGVGFSIVQGPAGIEVQNHMPDRLPIPPRFILLDVQRMLYPWLGDALLAGERIGRVAGETIEETWADGRLAERCFRRNDGEPAGTITIHYEWEHAEWHAPTRAVLDNGWFGYTLTIVTHSETLLPAAPR
jgi:hypothetical protein